MRIATIASALVAGLIGCSGGAGTPPAETAKPGVSVCEPDGWDIGDALTDGLFADVLDSQQWPDMTVRESQVLAWSVYSDDRPVVVHNALAWVQAYDEYGTEAWFVLLLARNPGDAWSLMSTDHQHSLGQMFDVLPTAAEIDAFVAESRWRWQVDDGWRYTAAAVCSQTWSDVAGAEPTHAYPPRTPSAL